MSTRSLGAAACCGAALLAASPAHSQSTPSVVAAGDRIVVTAARFGQPLDAVLGDVRVIERETIERAGPVGLPELLRRHAGAEIAVNGGPGQVSAVFLRGSNANHVVLLVDGVRVNSATTGTNAFEHLPLEQIERIEVLRAPASALYGADAIGGVIQVFTRDGGAGASAMVGAGSDGLRKASAGLGAKLGQAQFALQAGVTRSDGFSATNADAGPWTFDPDDDGHRNANLGASLSSEWAAGHRIRLAGQWSSSRTAFDAGPGGNDRNRQRLANVSLTSTDRLAEGWTSVARIARGSDRIETEGSYPGRFATDQDQVGWQHEIDAAGARWVAGLEWRRESVDSTTAYTTTERTVRSLHGGVSATLGAHALQASLRHDDDSQFGGHATGQLAWGLRLAPGWRASASIATAFKAPSFNDLYYPLEWGFSGNPALRPEKSRGAELSTRYERGGLRYGATLFENRIRDLIAVDPGFTTVINVNQARIRGLTLDGRWQFTRWHAAAEWTLQRPEDRATGLQLVRRAKQHGSASVGYAAGTWEAGAELTATGARFDRASNEPSSRMGGYALVNLHARVPLSGGWALAARLDNVADRDHEFARGYQTAGRSAFVALEWSQR